MTRNMNKGVGDGEWVGELGGGGGGGETRFLDDQPLSSSSVLFPPTLESGQKVHGSILSTNKQF